MFTNLNPVWAGLALLVGLALGYLVRHYRARHAKDSLEQKSEKALREAELQAKKLVLESQEKSASILGEAQKEERERKIELRRLEERLQKKEDSLDVERKEVEAQEKKYEAEMSRVGEIEAKTKELREKAVQELERVAGLSREEAKKKLFEELEAGEREEMAKTLARLEHERREAVEVKSAEIITSAIQRYARSSVADITTSVVHLPDEEIKGKIIGREGRNIRAFERLTIFYYSVPRWIHNTKN